MRFPWFQKRSASTVFVIQDGDARLDQPSRDCEVDFSLAESAFGGRGRQYVRPTISSVRFRGAFFVFCFAFLLLVGRAIDLQVVHAAQYRALAEGNRTRREVIPAPRGTLFDRKGRVLARNSPSFVVTLTPGELPKDETERRRVLDRAAELAGLQRTDLDLTLSEYASLPGEAVPVRKGLPYEAAMRFAIEAPDLPGFAVDASSIRTYDAGAKSLSHVLGYVGRLSAQEYAAFKDSGYRLQDEIGKTGLERGVEALLRGMPGRREVEIDARGRELSLVSQEDPIPGADLTLGLDVGLQTYAEERLHTAMEGVHKTRASLVAVDPMTGAIRALVSLPAYDNNAFARGIDSASYKALAEDPDHPLFPRAISGEFPSGSTFKPFVAYAALMEGIITPTTSFLSVGGIQVGPWFFPDWKAGGHGVADVRRALAESINTFFYVVGGGYNTVTGLGVERITDYARKFGFGKKTGIPLPGEADGFLPSKEWKEKAKGERWYVGDTYHLAIGQGDLLVTPLQLALATAMVANGGHALAPRIIEGIDGAVNAPDPDPPVANGDFDAAAIRVVREGMRQAVTSGSARRLLDLSEPAAGKTGTAQHTTHLPTHAWFVGFVPYDKPTLAVAILIEEGGEGSSIAVAIAHDIFQWWIAHGGE